MILRPANAVDVHKAVKLADVRRRCINDGDLNGVEILFEALFFEQGYWNSNVGGIGVDCLLVGTICCRRISIRRKGLFLQPTKIHDTWAVSGPLIAPVFNSLQSVLSSARIRYRKQRGGTDVSEEGKLDKCPLLATKVR